MKKKVFWDLENDKPLADQTSEDGIKHYSNTEIASFMARVVPEMVKNGVKQDDAEQRFLKAEIAFDNVIPNYSPREVAKLLSGDVDDDQNDDHSVLDRAIPKFDEAEAQEMAKDWARDLESGKGRTKYQNFGSNNSTDIPKFDEAEAQAEAEEWAKDLKDRKQGSGTSKQTNVNNDPNKFDEEAARREAEAWANNLPDA